MTKWLTFSHLRQRMGRISRGFGKISRGWLAVVVLVSGCTAAPAERPKQDQGEGVGEKALVASFRSEPRTFNPLIAVDSVSALVTGLSHAALVRVNRVTDRVEPWLAEEWSSSPDGLSYEFRLRRGVRFSDGEPFTARDVVFSFEAFYHESTGGSLPDSVRVNGLPLAAVALDEHTVRITYPAPFAPGIRILSNVPVVPRHRLQAALSDGALSEAWGVTTPPDEIVGLGPFQLSRYDPGQRVVVVRNTHYWRTGPDGESLPRLDRLTLEISSSQDTEMLRLGAGEIDLISDHIRAEDYPTLSRAAEDGRLRLFELGVALDADFLVFNLSPSAMADDRRRAWLQADDFRRAVAHAIDKQEFADTVYLGFAVPVHGPVSLSNKRWHNPNVTVYDHDVAEARRLLASLGLADRDSDGYLEDAGGEPVRLRLAVQSGHTVRQRAAAVIAEDLRQVGVRVDILAVEFGALLDRVQQMNFDAAYLGFQTTDTDPAANLDLWLSRSVMHFWNPSQSEPATGWEAQIDERMRAHVATSDEAERKRLFDEVQEIFAEHIPVVYFAAPEVTVAVSSRVTNVDPGVLRPYVFWNIDTVGVSAPDLP